jgi:hypothetical protein
LNAFTTAGGHYRVLPADLQEFAARYRMPIDLPERNGTPRH